MKDIINHIANRGVCIVLTNSTSLSCDRCNYYSITTIPQYVTTSSSSSRIKSNMTTWRSMCPVETSYQGHYVVVCGYDLPRETIIYRNPSLHDRECAMSFQKFEEARSSYGTDHDVIFVDIITSTSSHTISTKDPTVDTSRL